MDAIKLYITYIKLSGIYAYRSVKWYVSYFVGNKKGNPLCIRFALDNLDMSEKTLRKLMRSN